MPVDHEIAPLLQLLSANPAMETMTPEEARTAFRTLTVDMRDPATVVPVASVEETQVAGADRPLRARIYRPESAGAVPTVAMFHGGGFVIGDLDTHDNMARAICAGANAVVVSVDYRLAPEATFPAAPLDAIAATKDIASRLTDLGGSEVLAVAGDSSGGNLAAVVAQQVPGIKAQLLIYPVTDGGGSYPSLAENAVGYFLEASTMAWFIDNYAPDGIDPQDPLIAPMHGDLADLPPAVVATAEFDPLRDDGAAYAAALEAAGVQVTHTTYPGLIHGFFDMDAFSGAARTAIKESIERFAGLL
ncbi:MAG: alpha/beta hydrolase [Nocardioidaceae bacterium]|nr:alpha/beta hydrolase [Nocardioidaceae bacterium]MCL2612174.1 alpha/beta hydrolase [Nocardioidaceae bacterium]